MARSACKLELAFGIEFSDLYSRDGLARLDTAFLDHLRASDPAVAERLSSARATPDDLGRKAESELMIALAPHVEFFIGQLFGISAELQALREEHFSKSDIFAVKRNFVQRRALRSPAAKSPDAIDGPAVAKKLEALLGEPLSEDAYARHVALWLKSEATHAAELELAATYAAWATLTADGKRQHRAGVLFKQPAKRDPMNLIEIERRPRGEISVWAAPDGHRRERNGFQLTDRGTSLVGALDQANYCIWCHKQGKDSCSLGLRDRHSGNFEHDAFGGRLLGCPLEERISEMNLVKSEGHALGALAIVAVENPLCAATGHRICNDCVKACIYQKQQPVDIPQIESRILKDVLGLPWGVEIYSLLTRWNPLNFRRPRPRAATGRNVLVVGLGPAGFTLAHHLLNDGHSVVGIDGLKIEPLPEHLTGRRPDGSRVPFVPVRDLAELYEDLDKRTMAGFGGVAEYGITVRWDKNNLKIIRLLLERRDAFAAFGGVRMGGSITPDSAFAMGFDHVSLCMGAGKPTVIAMPNGLAHGVRQASDFLMALQLTGAAKTESLANLTVRLPIAVIGGGLTAIDTATEALAYYPVQVEKFLSRYEALNAAGATIDLDLAADEADIADEFIRHARALREERAAAAREGRAPRIAALLEDWGGATVVYRRRLTESPSYTLNHEEVEKAMEEGIGFAEGLSPTAVEVDNHGHATTLLLADNQSEGGKPLRLPARTILVAAGTQPNTVLSRERGIDVKLDGRYFQAVDETGQPVSPERSCKPQTPHMLMDRRADGRFVSFFGDLHPSFAGNVVKAMASATRGYTIITRLMEGLPAAAGRRPIEGFAQEFGAVVREVSRLTPTIVELIVQAPAAARAFEPGQFFRLQNFETHAPQVVGTRLATEALALTGAWVDREKGLVSVIVLEMGGSSDLCRRLKPGEPVVLMGPTGEATHIEAGQTYILAGGGLGNAVLFSIGQAARAKGSRTIYFAGYKKPQDRFKIDQIEAAADVVVWCSDEAPGFEPNRPQDRAFVGNIVDAMAAYARGALGAQSLRLDEAKHLIAIGSDGMMAAIARAREGVLRPHLHPEISAIGSINSPMQCMMKEICGQCLQTHRSPETGKETIVFTCACQDQPLETVDFGVLRTRLRQNSVQEKLTRHWIAHCLKQDAQEPVSQV
ncbi:MAG: FAD-dependent oxidoreductase [Pseudorhodoplanes sp.]|nr:Dihydroorotate dehydrogenase B (NAD(+)), electron transfer subunit [Pseudorhodoplanes sp.]MBW7947846.1 FAD-dependent oxidoreductase [Pseudorhodoplanes sp.]